MRRAIPNLPMALAENIGRVLRDVAREAPLTLRVQGGCMEPSVSDGDEVRVRRQRIYLPGDVLAVHGKDGRLTLHRCLGYVIARDGLGVVTQADSSNTADTRVPLDRVIGRAELPSPPLSTRVRSVTRYARWFGAAAARRVSRP